MDENINQLILDRISFLTQKYEKFYDKWNLDWKEAKYNFKKKTVVDGINDFELLDRIISFYQDVLKKIISNENEHEGLFNGFRIKSLYSIKNKLKRYCKKEDTKGKSPINKCLNDIMGFRLIYELDINETYLFLIDHFRDDDKIKIIKRDFDNYKAIHCIVSIDNFCLPWELQIWSILDEEQNYESHQTKYGRY